MDSDAVLLMRYATKRDAEAFDQLVRRHAAMVFAAARRVTGCPHDAQDVTQACFLDLARNAGSIHRSLGGWLHSAATHRAINAIRDAATRRRHERMHAATKPLVSDCESTWEKLAPIVDAAIAELDEDLREPLVLHFLQGKTHAEVAVELGVSRPTITRRLEAGVDVLRAKLKAGGVAASAAGLTALLANSADAGVIVPAPLSVSLGKLALAGVGPTPKVGLLTVILGSKLWAATIVLFAGVILLTAAQLIRSGSMTTSSTAVPASSVVIREGQWWDDTFSLAVEAAATRLGVKATYDDIYTLSTNPFAPGVQITEDCRAWWHWPGRATATDLIGARLGLRIEMMKLPPGPVWTPTANYDRLSQEYRRDKVVPALHAAEDAGSVVMCEYGWKPTQGKAFVVWCQWGLMTEAQDDGEVRGTTRDCADARIDATGTYLSIAPAMTTLTERQGDLEILRRAAERIRGHAEPYTDVPSAMRYGLDAMDAWIEQMVAVPGFCAVCQNKSGRGYSCAKANADYTILASRRAANFLRQAAARLGGQFQLHLDTAATRYERIATLLAPAIRDDDAGSYKQTVGTLAGQRAHADTLREVKAEYAAIATELEAALASEQVHREGNRVWIEGVPPLYWGRNQDTTYCGAMAAALAAVGPKLDYDTLMGDSGLAFRVRWWRSNDGLMWCPSSPVGEMPPWTGAVETSAGWRTKWEAHLDGVTDMSQFRSQVAKSIDAGRPLLAYMGNLDMSVIYGYEADGQRVLVRSYYGGDKEMVVPLSENKGMLMFLTERQAGLSRREAVIAGLKAAVRDWKSAPVDRPGLGGPGAYHMGDDAYATWIADTQDAGQLSDPDRRSMHHPRGWTFISLVDARHAAARYLRKSAGQFEGQAKKAMERAADLYEQTAKLCVKATFDDKDAFTFGDRGTFEQWTPEMQQKEAEVLAEARKLDAEAIAELEKRW